MTTPLHRNRNFLTLEILRFLFINGFQMQAVAIGWHVYAITGKAFDLGMVGLSTFIPFLIASMIAGDVADRFNRVRIMRFCQSGLVLCSIALCWIAQTDISVAWPVYVVAGFQGATRAFAGPASNALLPAIVAKEQFPNAVGWHASVWQVASILGPSIGGLVLSAFGGVDAVFLCAAFLETFSLLMLFVINKHHGVVDKPHKETTIQRLVGGINYIWKRPVILGAISLDLFAVLLGGAVALLPIYAKDILHVGPAGLGYLRTAPAIGATMMAVILANFPLKKNAGKKMLLATAIYGVATCLFGISQDFMLSMAALFVIGASDMVSVVVRHTLVQMYTPHNMRGRVSAVNQVFIGASNELGEFESGITASWFGVVPAVIIGGIGTCCIVALWGKFFPALRKVNSLSDAH